MAIIQNLFIYRSKVEPENKSFICARTVQVREKIEIELLIWDVDHWITLGDSSIIEEFRNYPWDTLTPDVPTPIEDGTDIFTAITSLHSLVKENVKNILTLENKQTSIDADIIMLNSRVDDVGNTILDVKDDIIAINNDLSVINTDIINVNNRVNDTNTRIDETNNNVQDLDDKIVGLDENIQANLIELYNIKLNKAPLNDLPLLNDNGVIDNAYLPASQIAVTGVKGHQESNYRNGNVDLTIQNILGDLQGNEIESIGEELYTISTPNNVEYVTTYRKDTAGFTHLTQHPYSEFALKPDLLREFTFIVDSQETLNMWQNGVDGDFSSILVRPGNYVIGDNGIILNDSERVLALPGAIFTYNGTGAAFYFDEDVYNDRYSYIKNSYDGLHVRLTKAGNYAFQYCFYLKNCIVFQNAPFEIGIPNVSFFKCANLHNCISQNTLFFTGTGNETIEHFIECRDLYNCTVITGNVVISHHNGFSNCDRLINCYASINCNVVEVGSLFESCRHLINCEGVVLNSTNHSTNIFHSCSRLLQCSATHSGTSILGGENSCFSRCRSMQNNQAQHVVPEASAKYDLCYANSTGTAYPVSDTPNGGFNS